MFRVRGEDSIRIRSAYVSPYRFRNFGLDTKFLLSSSLLFSCGLRVGLGTLPVRTLFRLRRLVYETFDLSDLGVEYLSLCIERQV